MISLQTYSSSDARWFAIRQSPGNTASVSACPTDTLQTLGRFFCLSFFFISTYRLSSDDNLGSEGHACLGQDLLLHVPVIVDSSISYFRGENGVGLERQLLIKNFNSKKQDNSRWVAPHADCFCVCLLKHDWSILVGLETGYKQKQNASNTKKILHSYADIRL